MDLMKTQITIFLNVYFNIIKLTDMYRNHKQNHSVTDLGNSSSGQILEL